MSGRKVIMGAGVLVAATFVAGAMAGVRHRARAATRSSAPGERSAPATVSSPVATTESRSTKRGACTSRTPTTTESRCSPRPVRSSASGARSEAETVSSRAEDIAVSPDGTVWVADRGTCGVQAFSSGGAFRTSIAMPSEAAQGVAVDADGNVFVSVEGGKLGGYRVFAKTATGWEPRGGLNAGGNYRADDIEVSPDGSIYLLTSARLSPTTIACGITPPTERPRPLGS